MVVLLPLAVISLLWGLPALLISYISPLLLGAVVLIVIIYMGFKERRERGL